MIKEKFGLAKTATGNLLQITKFFYFNFYFINIFFFYNFSEKTAQLNDGAVFPIHLFQLNS